MPNSTRWPSFRRAKRGRGIVAGPAQREGAEERGSHRAVRSPARRLDEPSAMRAIQRSGGTKRAGPRAVDGPEGVSIAIVH